MTTDYALARAFESLEDVVPDPDAEFAALTARLDGLGRRRACRAAAGGFAVAGLATAVAVGVASAPAGKPTHERGLDAEPSVRVSSPARPVMRQVAFSTRLATTTGSDGVTRPVVTVDASWLPRGAKLEQAGADDYPGDGGYKQWTVPYPDGQVGQDGTPNEYEVSVGVYGSDGLPSRYMTAQGRDLTVAGRPARLYTTRLFTVIDVDLGHGQIGQSIVASDPDELSAADALATVTRIAEGLEYDQREPLPVTAVLSTAPAGTTIVSAYSTLGQLTYYRLDDDTDGAEVGIGDMAEKYPAPIHGESGRDVQGRPTVVIHDQGRTILYIEGLDGRFTKVFSGKGAETLQDLYLIADGIRAVR